VSSHRDNKTSIWLMVIAEEFFRLFGTQCSYGSYFEFACAIALSWSPPDYGQWFMCVSMFEPYQNFTILLVLDVYAQKIS